MIVLFDVRWSATNISSPIATSESLTISTVKGSSSVFAAVATTREPPRSGSRARRGGRLLDHRRPVELGARAEQRTFEDPRLVPAELVEVDVTRALQRALRAPVRRDRAQLGLRHRAEAGEAEVHELDR